MTDFERIEKSCYILENTKDFDDCCRLMLEHIEKYINDCLSSCTKGEMPFMCFCLQSIYNSYIKQLKQDLSSYSFFKMLCESVSVEETTFILPGNFLIKGDDTNEL